MEVHIGFGVAYPKRAQKLLVGRSQTLLNYYFICGNPSLTLHFLLLIIVYFCSFLLCLCGCSSTDLSLPDFFKKRKRFFARFFRQNHFLALIPCSFFHNVEKSTIFAEFSTVQKKFGSRDNGSLHHITTNYSKSSSGLRFAP